MLHESQSLCEVLWEPSELVAHKTPKKHKFFSQNIRSILTDQLTFSGSPVPLLHIVNIFLHCPRPALVAGKISSAMEAPNLLLALSPRKLQSPFPPRSFPTKIKMKSQTPVCSTTPFLCLSHPQWPQCCAARWSQRHRPMQGAPSTASSGGKCSVPTLQTCHPQAVPKLPAMAGGERGSLDSPWVQSSLSWCWA